MEAQNSLRRQILRQIKKTIWFAKRKLIAVFIYTVLIIFLITDAAGRPSRDWADPIAIFVLAITLLSSEVNRIFDRSSDTARAQLSRILAQVDIKPEEALKEWEIWSNSLDHREIIEQNPIVADIYNSIVKALHNKIPDLLLVSGKELLSWQEQPNPTGLENPWDNGLQILRRCAILLEKSGGLGISPQDQIRSAYLYQIYQVFLRPNVVSRESITALFSLWETYQRYINEIAVQFLLAVGLQKNWDSIKGYLQTDKFRPLVFDSRIYLSAPYRIDLASRRQIKSWLLPHIQPCDPGLQTWLKLGEFIWPIVTRPFENDILLPITQFPDKLYVNFIQQSPLLFFSTNQNDLLLGSYILRYPQQNDWFFPIRYPVRISGIREVRKSGVMDRKDLYQQVASCWVDFLAKNPDLYFDLTPDLEEHLINMLSQCPNHVSQLISRLKRLHKNPDGQRLIECLRSDIHEIRIPDFDIPPISDILSIFPPGFNGSSVILLFDAEALQEDIEYYLKLFFAEIYPRNDPRVKLAIFSPLEFLSLPVLKQACPLTWSEGELKEILRNRLMYARLEQAYIERHEPSITSPRDMSPFDNLFQENFLGPLSPMPTDVIARAAHGSLSVFLDLIDRIIQNHVSRQPGSLYLTEEDINPVCPLDVSSE